MTVRRRATLIMAYYNNPGMLRAQLEHTRRVSKELRANMNVIVVDDGSPDHPAEPGDCGCPLEIWRIDVDVRWNQDAARNIGARHCKTEWMLLTDIDHMVPEATWNYVLSADLSPLATYKFGRVSAPAMTPYKPHPNSYFMTQRTWDATGGYDERLAGYYGTDGDFRDRLIAVSPVIDLSQLLLIRVPREHIPDASTPSSYGRKSAEDSAKIREIKGNRRAIQGWRPLTLTFPHHRVFPPATKE